MKPHPHAALMAEYAKDAAETETPWERWEFTYSGMRWQQATQSPSWHADNQYRRRPRTININGHEVPEPLRECEAGEEVWRVNTTSDTGVGDVMFCDIWQPQLDAGLIHSTREAAEAHYKALISFTKKP